MEAALNLIDALKDDHNDARLDELRSLVASPSLDDLESIIEQIASTPDGKKRLIKRGKRLIKKIMGR